MYMGLSIILQRIHHEYTSICVLTLHSPASVASQILLRWWLRHCLPMRLLCWCWRFFRCWLSCWLVRHFFRFWLRCWFIWHHFHLMCSTSLLALSFQFLQQSLTIGIRPQFPQQLPFPHSRPHLLHCRLGLGWLSRGRPFRLWLRGHRGRLFSRDRDRLLIVWVSGRFRNILLWVGLVWRLHVVYRRVTPQSGVGLLILVFYTRQCVSNPVGSKDDIKCPDAAHRTCSQGCSRS